MRAVVEGIAAQLAVLAGSLAEDLGRPIARLRVDGGLAQSAVLMQAQVDLLQAPVVVYSSPHATALGAAALASLGVSPRFGLADVTGPWTPAVVYQPHWTADRAGDLLIRWRAAADAALPHEAPCSTSTCSTSTWPSSTWPSSAGESWAAPSRASSPGEADGPPVSVALIEARGDVGDVTSKANTAILRTGFDAAPGSLQSAMVSHGYRLLSAYATDTGDQRP